MEGGGGEGEGTRVDLISIRTDEAGARLALVTGKKAVRPHLSLPRKARCHHPRRCHRHCLPPKKRNRLIYLPGSLSPRWRAVNALQRGILLEFENTVNIKGDVHGIRLRH